MRLARDVLNSGYLGFSLEPMLHIMTGNVSTLGKQIVGPPGYFSMGRFYGGIVLVVVLVELMFMPVFERTSPGPIAVFLPEQ